MLTKEKEVSPMQMDIRMLEQDETVASLCGVDKS
jgi:hypothetical protein